MTDAGSRTGSDRVHGGCVVVTSGVDGVLVRSSRESGGAVLRFSHDEWAAFVAGVRDGEFDPAALDS